MTPRKSGLAAFLFDYGSQETHDFTFVQYKRAAALAASEQGRSSPLPDPGDFTMAQVSLRPTISHFGFNRKAAGSGERAFNISIPSAARPIPISRSSSCSGRHRA